MILPWVADPQPFGFDAGIDSIAVSGHKFIGSPMPCGVVLARRRHVDRVARSVEYVGCMDTTIAGSRNALTPLILWSAIQRWGEEGLRQRAAGLFGRGRLRDRAVQGRRHPGVAAPEFRSPWSFPARRRKSSTLADRAEPRHRAHHHHAARHPR